MLVQLTMFPTDKRTESVSADVARVIDIIDRSGLPYKLTAMATIIEGEWAPVMRVVNKARLMLKKTHSRVYIIMAIDDRKDAKNRLTGKIQSVEKKLGRKVQDLMNDVCVVYISIPRDEADKMARALVEQRLAACINVTPKIHSFFWWDDAVQEDEESLLIIKTTRQKFAELRDYVIENHPYELPEIIAMPLVEGSSEYIEWVKREVSRS